MTNKNYKVVVNRESYVLRIPGNGTEEMISRVDEIQNAVFANKLKIDSELIYFNEDSGIKLSRFIENAETLNPESSKNKNNIKKVCEILRKLHNCKMKMNNKFDVYEKIAHYEKILHNCNGVNFYDYNEVKNKVILLKEVMNNLEVELVPCHNDTVAENFVKSGEGKMYLIDWEYGGMNDPMWDIAAYCLENNFSPQEEEVFIETYFNGEVSEKYRIRILINKIYQDFLWSLWANVKEANGDNFGSYGIDRYNRAKQNLKLLMEKKVI